MVYCMLLFSGLSIISAAIIAGLGSLVCSWFCFTLSSNDRKTGHNEVLFERINPSIDLSPTTTILNCVRKFHAEKERVSWFGKYLIECKWYWRFSQDDFSHDRMKNCCCCRHYQHSILQQRPHENEPFLREIYEMAIGEKTLVCFLLILYLWYVWFLSIVLLLWWLFCCLGSCTKRSSDSLLCFKYFVLDLTSSSLHLHIYLSKF